MKHFAAAALLIFGATSASAVSIANGSFEVGAAIPAGGFITVPALNSTAITGWTVGGGGVDYVGTYWQAADGVRSVDLSGNSAGGISQTISTIAGRSYRVAFYLSGNPDAGVGQKVAVTSVSGNLPDIEFYNVGAANSRTNMLWQRFTYDFTAFDTTSTLTFASATRTAFGPAVDNVSISTIPEPATWATLVLGMGLVGAFARDRRRRTVAA